MRRVGERGITLIEMMVAITVGLILIAGVVQLFVSNKKAYRVQEAANVLDENARYAANQLEYHLRMADHWGGVKASDVTVDGGVAALAADCKPASPTISATGVQGFDGAGANPPLACIPKADYAADTDVVALHFAGPLRIDSATVQKDATGLYVRAGVGRRAMIFDGEDIAKLPGDLYDPAKPDPDPIANYGYNAVVYFIRRCANQDLALATPVCDAKSDTTPTLTRLVLSGNQLVQEDLVAGVEQMQVSYGVDTNGDRSVDRYENATEVTGANDWPNVVAVRLSLLVRNPELDPVFTDTATYQLLGGAGGTTVAVTPAAAVQHYHRKLFNFTVQIRNTTRG
ncbi:MAG: PilW family protein [Gammaproteobacteria bacterium]|nr:PilW family protein [Gammaproteobacteria bacterium]